MRSGEVPADEHLSAFWRLPVVLFAVVTPDGRFRHVNGAWQSMLGREPAELAGHSIFEHIHPDDREPTQAELEQLVSSGTVTVDFELRFRDGAGKYQWLRWNAFGSDNDDVYAVGRDVTVRKEHEAALRESEERFRLAMENAPIGMALVDLDGSWLEVNDALCDIVGRSADELLDLTFQDITHPEDLDDDLMLLARLVGGDIDGYQLEKRYIHAAGHTVWIELSVSLVRDEDDKPRYFISQIQDITRQKRYEEHLERSIRDLERSNTDLERFAAVASHDLKSPLTNLLGLVQLLDRVYGQTLDEQGRHVLERVERNATRLGELVDALLQLARLRASSVEPEPVDTEEVLAEVMERLSGEIEACGARIEIDALPVVHADRAHLDLLFQNLLSNSLKFCHPDRVPVVRITADRDGQRWRFVVEDNGVGFDAEDREAIFEMFGRTHEGKQLEGAGIGLATCKRIVERYGGQIEAAPRREGGARFVFDLPGGEEAPLSR